MALFSFYNTRKPRQFEHKPIYYDPRREALAEREKKIKRELGMEEIDENFKPSIKGTFVEGTSHLKKSHAKGDDARARLWKSARLILALVVLGVLLWYLLWK